MTTPILVGCKDWDFNLHYRRALCSMKSDSVNKLRFHVQSTNLWFEGFLSESSARGCEQLQERHRSHFAVCHGCRLVNRPSGAKSGGIDLVFLCLSNWWSYLQLVCSAKFSSHGWERGCAYATNTARTHLKKRGGLNSIWVSSPTTCKMSKTHLQVSFGV